MEASNIDIKETVPASRKLQADDARLMLQSATKLIALKGKKINEFKGDNIGSTEAINSMLGPTGNLRAPTLRMGKKLIVGFNEEIFAKEFG